MGRAASHGGGGRGVVFQRPRRRVHRRRQGVRQPRVHRLRPEGGSLRRMVCKDRSRSARQRRRGVNAVGRQARGVPVRGTRRWQCEARAGSPGRQTQDPHRDPWRRRTLPLRPVARLLAGAGRLRTHPRHFAGGATSPPVRREGAGRAGGQAGPEERDTGAAVGLSDASWGRFLRPGRHQAGSGLPRVDSVRPEPGRKRAVDEAGQGRAGRPFGDPQGRRVLRVLVERSAVRAEQGVQRIPGVRRTCTERRLYRRSERPPLAGLRDSRTGRSQRGHLRDHGRRMHTLRGLRRRGQGHAERELRRPRPDAAGAVRRSRLRLGAYGLHAPHRPLSEQGPLLRRLFRHARAPRGPQVQG